MSAVVVVAPVPFVTTHAQVFADVVTLFMLRAAPVVAPDMLNSSLVLEPAIEVLPMVRVKSAAAAIDTLLKVTEPTRPLQFTVPDAAPVPVATLNETPLPAAEDTKLPLVAVISPKVAVMVVVAVTEPGAVRALARAKVIWFVPPTDVIWFAVPLRLIVPPVGTTGVVPESGVRVFTSVVAPPIAAQVTVPFIPVFLTAMYAEEAVVLTAIVPTATPVAALEGAAVSTITFAGLGTCPPP